MRFKHNGVCQIKNVVVSKQPDQSQRYIGWTHLERRVKERLYKQATHQQIQAFLNELAELVLLDLQGVNCNINRFILKMGTYGIVVTCESDILVLHTMMLPGNWAQRDYLFASAALGQELADDISSKLWGLLLQWKQRLQQ